MACLPRSAERATPRISQARGLCDHEGVPRGTASKVERRYAVRLTVPRRGGWRVWGAVRADFERGLADAADPAIVSAEIASELRRGADYVQVTIAFTVVTTDVGRRAGHRVGRFPRYRPG